MIRLERVNKIHEPDRFQSLHEVSCEVDTGQLVAIRGVSGSGKSTLLSIIGALQRPTTGEVIVSGQRVAKLPDHHASSFRASTIGFIFQTFSLWEEFTVEENVALPLIPTGENPKEIAEKVHKALEAANIAHKARQRSRDLSGGEKQRASIARALVNNAPILLCDEPSANLDRDNALAFVQTLERLKQQGKTIVVATHDPLLCQPAFVDSVLDLEAGRIIKP